MARLRFQRTLCFAVAGMVVFDGLVALWPYDWRRLAAGDWNDWRSIAFGETLFLGPLAAVIALRRSRASRVIAVGLLLGFAARLHSIETDPLFDRDMQFIKMDPFLGLYELVFGIGGWLLALVAAPFVLLRRFEAKRIDVRDA